MQDFDDADKSGFVSHTAQSLKDCSVKDELKLA